jgi:hypothetical protein
LVDQLPYHLEDLPLFSGRRKTHTGSPFYPHDFFPVWQGGPSPLYSPDQKGNLIIALTPQLLREEG